jgi:hypothetical protein
MNIALTVKVLVIAACGLAVIAGASAQSTPPTLEGTIKVHPSPQVQDQAQSQTQVPADCVCTMQYDPVCARIGSGIETTYSNACVARCTGATEIRPGPC